MTTSEVSELQQKIRRFIASKGRGRDEDLEQEMIFDYLKLTKERPDVVINMANVYLHALDRIRPRAGYAPDGSRPPRDAMEHRAREPEAVSEGEMEPLVNRVVSMDAYRKAPIAEVRVMRRKMSRAQYLARLPFGHLPFCL